MPLGTPPTEHFANPFVGRDREMARLDAALADARAGRGRLVVLVGDPGIGKTRIAEKLSDRARESGVQVLIGRCHEGAGAPAFLPWRQIVRAYIGRVDLKALAQDLGTGAADIARVVEDLRRVFPDLPAIPASSEADEARYHLFDAFTRFLCTAARRQPLLLILDDLHWADLASLHLLQFLAREMADSPLLIVGTYRESEAKGEAAKAQALGSLGRERLYERIAMRGLSPDEVGTLVTALVGIPPSESLLRTLHERTEGNPFFLTEVARQLQEQELLAHDSTPASRGESLSVPESVRAVVTQRLIHLRPQTRAFLNTAAVVGRDFELAPVAAALECKRESVLSFAGEAADAGILLPLTAAATAARFSHALVRDAVYDGLLAEERAAAHGRVGRALEAHWHLALDERAGELAIHFLSSTAAGDSHRAVDYAVRAAERAAAEIAYDESIHWYEQGIEALSIEQPLAAGRTCRLLLALGEAQAAVSHVHEVRDTFRRAAKISRLLGDAEALAQAANGFARVPLVDGSVDTEAVELLEAALAALPAADGPLRAAALSMLACALQHVPGTQERRALLCRQASDMARRCGDLRVLARTLYDQRNALFAPETLDDRFAAANELLDLAQRTADRQMLLRARYCRIIDLIELRRLPEADAEIDALGQLAMELREPWHHWYADWFRATRALMSGRFDEGEQLAQSAFAHGERVAPELALQVLGVQISVLRALQGRCAEMIAAIKNLVEQSPQIAGWRCALAYHCAETDDTEMARHHFEILAIDDFAAIPRDGSWFVSVSQLADVCVYLDDTARAQVLYELLQPYGDRLMTINRALACSAAGEHYLGILATTLGRWSAARIHLERAVEIHRRLGMHPWVAQSLYDSARLLAAANPIDGREAALLALAEAAELAERIGMARLSIKVATLRANLDAATPDSPAARTTPAAPAVAASDIDGSSFRKNGEFWVLGFAGRVCHLKDSRGLQYLVQLLRHPGRQFHVTEILALTGGGAVAGAAPQGLTVSKANDALPGLDPQARREYRARLIELEQDLAEAESHNNVGTAERCRIEIEMLAHEIAGTVRGSDAGERARGSITKRIKSALGKIQDAHPELGRHLNATVKTGYFCSYSPDPRHPIDWQS